jgi:hypothetical protein
MSTSVVTPGAFSDATSMLSSIPADIMADFNLAGSGDAPLVEDAPIEDTPVEEPSVEDAPIEDVPSDEPQPELSAEPEPSVDPVDPPAPAEDLPEGVTKGKDSKGRQKYFLDPNRYETVYGNHKMVQEAQKMLGEPLTQESLEVRNRAYLAQERLFSNLTSGDPALQSDVVDFMIGEMTGAREAGETGVDPTVPFAETVYTKLRDTAPDGYANLRYLAARDLVGEMFEQASATNDNGLFAAAQQFARKLAGIGDKPAEMTDAQYVEHVREVTNRAGLPFYTPQEMKGLNRGPDPLTAAQRRIQELEAQVNGRGKATEAEQFRAWDQNHVQTVNQAVDDEAVMPSLGESVKTAWEKFPDDYTDKVLTPLKSKVTAAVKSDPVLNQRVTELRARISRAASEQVRNNLGEQIKSLVVNRARIAADEAKGPILQKAAEWLKWRSQQTNGRREAGQNRTAPKGTSTPVNRSLIPDIPQFKGAENGKGGMFDSKTALQQAARLMAAMSR